MKKELKRMLRLFFKLKTTRFEIPVLPRSKLAQFQNRFRPDFYLMSFCEPSIYFQYMICLFLWRVGSAKQQAWLHIFGDIDHPHLPVDPYYIYRESHAEHPYGVVAFCAKNKQHTSIAA